MNTALVVGSDGQIGGALVRSLSGHGWDVYGTTRRQTADARMHYLDLTAAGGYQPLPQVDVAFLCAAETKLSRCSSDPVTTKRINVDGPVSLATRLLPQGTFVVFLSSNAVFDGRVAYCSETDPVCPKTVYGDQKARAEQHLLALGQRVAVVRLTKVLTPRTTVISDWIDSLRHRKPIHPFSDVVLAPLSMTVVTQVLMKIADSQCPGIIHLSGSRDVSYADLAYYIARRMDVHDDLIRPIRSSEAGLPRDYQVAHTTLGCRRLQELFDILPPDPWNVVDQVLKESFDV